MTKSIDLPALDTHNISPMVLEAMSKGATSANHASDPDKITLTFAKEADAKAFKVALDAHMASAEPVAVDAEGDAKNAA